MTHIVNNLMPIYETFLNKSSLLFFILDQQGTIQSANRSAHKFIGDTLTGKPFESIVLDFYNTFDLDSLRQKENVVHSLNLKRRNGLPQTYLFKFKTHATSIYAVGELDNDELEAVRKEILGLNEELSNLTRELHKKNAQLDGLNQEKNQFLGMAAHDLRKPIGLILSYSEFLIDEASPDLNAEHIGFLNTIQKSCVFMKRIVDDFLDISAIEAGEFELDLRSVNIGDVLEQGLRLNKLQAEKKGISLMVKNGLELPRLLIDQSKIEQVITNLVSNAIEHSPPKSQVEVTLTFDAGQIKFSVEDQGPGIPKDELDKMFKPFKKISIKKTGGEKSTGLGMVIARKIIEAHNGTIWINSKLNKGTHVSFILPEKGAVHE